MRGLARGMVFGYLFYAAPRRLDRARRSQTHEASPPATPKSVLIDVTFGDLLEGGGQGRHGDCAKCPTPFHAPILCPVYRQLATTRYIPVINNRANFFLFLKMTSNGGRPCVISRQSFCSRR